MEPSRLKKFEEAFQNYINVTLKSKWNFRENYHVEALDDVVSMTNRSQYYQLISILGIREYRNIFINTILPVFSQIYPDAKNYGIYLETLIKDIAHHIKINIKKLIYLDMIP